MRSLLRDDCLPRIHFEEPVRLEVLDGGQVLSGVGLNLSCGGMFIRTEELLAEGTRVKVYFALPGGNPLGAEAVVVRAVATDDPREQFGLAVRFEELASSTQRELAVYVESWLLRPSDGQRLRLQLDGSDLAILARPQFCRGNLLSVSAELPFLRVGSSVHLLDTDGLPLESGAIRWVSVQLAPDSGVPQLQVGIEIDPPVDSAELPEPECDPVCCLEFVSEAQTLDAQLRTARRQAAARA